MTTVVTVTPNPALDQTVRVRNLTLGDVNRAESLEFNAGGKGVNVAGCLADYGIATIATGLLGADDGAAFDAMFADKQIADRFVRIAGRTRINVKLVDDARGETTDINLATSRPAAADVAALERRIAELAAPGRWFVLAGSLPPGVDASFYRRATRALHDAGARVALDTSGAPLADALAAADPRELPDLAKPNLAELEAALGRALAGDDAIVRAACELAARGIARVVVSLGAQGALGVAADFGADVGADVGANAVAPRPIAYRVFRATPPRVPVASTVGAGDAFVAGLVASLTEARAWGDTGRRATAFAAAKLARVGPHLPDRATLAALAAQVEVDTFTLAAEADGAVHS
ncbi:1-phosphofructokinase family hexose kinase [Burkholderia thailandensis]|uniref:1-phosphofructokinase family hexose kinase n=1 Tax=Burkholderia thailandensis TaxID=57975 RepID=UPI0003EC7338|nr:1-phosphofructokinase family hexose kinase [Burkholderia thailandensis]AHI81854.1 1-phosphofructokinase [Burkholderia thailandensis E444]AIS98259.1 hexose kinase, 1-phosphofructokinase family protein [Burkholderia thailandensis MSMB59]AIT22850.1 hexose kinase, 1-phosphofructokinase family protein [Burkholderia thailandensis E254]AOJ47930.1 1-phosphofructokinase [Burkholderia thailandensis]AWY64118.1 1-phosphofructokinase [Burkholderia thailandensis]